MSRCPGAARCLSVTGALLPRRRCLCRRKQQHLRTLRRTRHPVACWVPPWVRRILWLALQLSPWKKRIPVAASGSDGTLCPSHGAAGSGVETHRHHHEEQRSNVMVISIIIIIVTVSIFRSRLPSLNLAQDAPGACQPGSCAMATRGSGADDCGWETSPDWTWGKAQWSWQWTDRKDQWSHKNWRYGATAWPAVQEPAGEASSAEQATAAPEAAAASATGAGHDAPDSDDTHPPAPTSRALVLLPQPGEAGGAAQPACRREAKQAALLSLPSPGLGHAS